jgi:hypothetical protein
VYSLVDNLPTFRKNLLLPSSGLLYIYHTTRYQIPEDSNLVTTVAISKLLKLFIYPVQLIYYYYLFTKYDKFILCDFVYYFVANNGIIFLLM